MSVAVAAGAIIALQLEPDASEEIAWAGVSTGNQPTYDLRYLKCQQYQHDAQASEFHAADSLACASCWYFSPSMQFARQRGKAGGTRFQRWEPLLPSLADASVPIHSGAYPPMTLQQHAIEIWHAGVAAVHGRTLVEHAVTVAQGQLVAGDCRIDLDGFDRILVVGGGKFSHLMAEGLEAKLGEEFCKAKQLSGLVTVPDGEQADTQFIEVSECRPKGTNLPTQRVVEATRRMSALLKDADERTLVIGLISGGGSALMEDSPLPLADVIAATNWLAGRGANIIELNSVRVAISHVKGGGLARAASPAQVLGLIVSDVPGDDVRFVSSGPTVPFGECPFERAKEVLIRFGASDSGDFPASVIRYVDLAESPVGAGPAQRIDNVLIGNAEVAIEAAREKAIALGYEIESTDPLAAAVNCRQVGESAAGWCQRTSDQPRCAISIGEPIATPGTNAGSGGRNQHAVLHALSLLVDNPLADGNYCFLSAGTDGEDGNTTVAGAVVTSDRIRELAEEDGQAEEAARFLDAWDSHRFLAARGLVFASGSTQTNVSDLRVLLYGSADGSGGAVFRG